MTPPSRSHARARVARGGVSGAALVIFFLAFAALRAGAIVLDSGDGRGNTEPPPDLPGWENVGRRLAGPSIVYLGDRWVVTASHVGAGIVELAGERYDPVPGTLNRLVNRDGSQADLLMFRIARDPGLPRHPLAERTPRIGEDVVLVGMGSTRGPWITVRAHRGRLIDGFFWGTSGIKQWGTNRVSGGVRPIPHEGGFTVAIPTMFERIDDIMGTRHEAAAATGDSGGALFARYDALRPELGWVLTGVLFSVSALSDQPPRTSLYGSLTYSADVATYRDQMVTILREGCLEAAGAHGGIDEAACSTGAVEGRAWARVTGHGARWLMAALVALIVWRSVALWRARGPDLDADSGA